MANSLTAAFVLSPFLFAWWLSAGDPQAYYLATQEDGTAEWATFWAFLLAAPLWILAARRSRDTSPRLGFGIALAAFCAFVAFEEISWGQRLLGYRPPDYFLAENFQQELNFHNVVDTGYRKLALKAVLLGYGVALPLVGTLGLVRRWFERLGISAPPLALVPAFAVAYAVYEGYPWSHTGEWVELVLGLLFLAAAAMTPQEPAQVGARRSALPAAWAAGSLILGLASTFAFGILAGPDPAREQLARREVAALAADFAGEVVLSDCSLHKRLYTFAVESGQSGLENGAFARMQQRGLPEPRARFLLDPWNSPYWLRDRCEDGRRWAFVYSFGPNRRRDSTEREILGDDIGQVWHDAPDD